MGSRRACVLVLAAGVALAAAAGLARADSILIAVDSSDDDIATDALVRSTAEAKVLVLKWNVVAADVAAERGVALERIRGCLERGTPCMKALVEPAGADRVLLILVDRRQGVQGESQWLVVGRLIDGASGELVVSDQRLCDECSAEKLPPYVEDMTAGLLARDPAHAGAAIEAPPLAAPPPPDVPRPYRLWKWVALGAGVAAAAGGVALIVMDRPAVEGGAQQPTSRDTALPGYIGVGVGAALIATGVVLWVKDSHAGAGAAAPPEPPLAPAALPTEGGVVFSLGGRF